MNQSGKMKKSFFFLLLSVLGIISFDGISQVKLEKLRCEHLRNPTGIDDPHPRFTWQIQSEQPGYLQNAFQLVVGTDVDEVAGGEGNVWDSGTVKSTLIPVIYDGPELQPFTRYYWSVRVQDKTNNLTDWLGKAIEAKSDFDVYLQQNPNDASAFINRAGTRFPDDMEGVVSDCTKTIELEPENKNAWFLRGLAYWEMGFKEKACNDFSRAIDLGFSILRIAEDQRCSEYWNTNK